jgi:lysophospholipase L1-like esterase
MMAASESRLRGLRYAAIQMLLMTVACVVAFAFLELGLRVYSPFELIIKGDRIVLPANRKLTMVNDGSSRAFRSSRWITNKLDEVIVHNKNSLGFRGAEPPESFAEHLTVIAVGGSTTECFYLTDGKTWPDRLSSRLSETFSDVWVNNAGLDGHSTYGHTVLLEDHIAALKPKVVLFLIGINDLHAEHALVADRRIQRVGLDTASLKRFLISAANYSQVLNLSLNLYRHLSASLLGFDYSADFDLVTVAHRTVSASERATAYQRYASRLPAFRERLLNLIAVSRRNGIEPVLITQPVLYGRVNDDVTAVDLRTVVAGELNGETEWDALEMYNNATRETGQRENVLVIDLAAKLPKSSRYYYDFFHYTNEGARAVGDIVYETLCPFLAQKYPRYMRGTCRSATVNGVDEASLSVVTSPVAAHQR